VKVGDLVQFAKRFGHKNHEKYLVMSQVETWDRKGPSSQFSKWKIFNTVTGKTHVQALRDLEVISESQD